MTAKDLHIAPIAAADARRAIRRFHYSGKIVQNSQLHLGVFLNKRLEGAMQFGPSLDKRKIQQLVTGTGWNEFIELNRLAFSDELPRNSESRALAIAFRLIRKHYPHIKWIVSFADATQCGDGTIYRAAGFLLTAINKSLNLVQLPNNTVIHKMTLESNPTAPRKELNGRSYYEITNGRYDFAHYARAVGGHVIPGYQFRYIYPIDPTVTDRLNVPIIPYADIPKECKMYLGKRASEAGDDPTKGTAAVQH
jgi:hypothetical protein